MIIEAVRIPREAAQSAQGTIKKAEGKAPSRVQSDRSKPLSYSREGARHTVRGSAASSSHRQNKGGAIRSRGHQGIPQGARQLKSTWKVVKPRREVQKPKTEYPKRRGPKMYPTGLATSHPTSHTLQQHAMKGCPSKMGRHGTKEEMHAAREREEIMYQRAIPQQKRRIRRRSTRG